MKSWKQLLPKNIYSAEQVRRLEQAWFDSGQNETEIMDRAGKTAFEALLQHYPNTKNLFICCGPGNNGGDGYVVAYYAALQGLNVTVLSIGNSTKSSSSAKTMRERCQHNNICIHSYENISTPQLQALFNKPIDVIVDAIFGIGLSAPVHSPYAELIEQINASSLPVFAIDIPSGIHADKGCVMGHAIRAEKTITFIALKLGLLTGDAANYVGELEFADLNLPKKLLENIPPQAEITQLSEIPKAFPARKPTAHKGDYGHVLIIGGDYGYGGAPLLAGMACLRMGAGLVSIATRPEHVNAIISRQPEIMAHGITHIQQLHPLLEKASFIVLGPGLGQSPWSCSIYQQTLAYKKPMLLDADALNLLAKDPQKLPQAILTPHPGEASRLLDISTMNVQHDRLKAAKALAEKYASVIVLKGNGSLIYQNTLSHPYLSLSGNPGMASGGMGDVLNGFIAGAYSQGLSLAQAAKIGVELHGHTADLAMKYRSERSLCATDLIDLIL